MDYIKHTKKELSKLMSELKGGNYNIPRFQREFVWKAPKVISLLQSIESHYPIGIITTARVREDALRGRNDIIDALVNNNYESEASIVVDGQQRLTSIAIIWFAPDLTKLIRRKKIEKKHAQTINAIINKVCIYENEVILLDSLAERISEEENKSLVNANAMAAGYAISNNDINEVLRKKIGKYPVFTHALYNYDLQGIINIFQVMNKKVKPLTHVDLMNGSMFSVSNDNFDLITFISNSNMRWKSRGKINDKLFALLMKIFSDLKIGDATTVQYKTDKLVEWSSNRKYVESFIEKQEVFIDNIKLVFKVLDEKLNIYIIKNIPKEVYFLVIFALVCLVHPIDRKDRFNMLFKKLIPYISRRLLKGDYASSPNAKACDDINQFLLKLVNDVDVSDKLAKLDDWNELFDLSFRENTNYKRRNQAFFKLGRSVLAGLHPKNIFDSEYVPVNPNEVKEHKVDIHHFIPKNSDFEKKYFFGNQLDRIGNLALLTADENRKTIRDKDVDIYLSEAIKLNKDFNQSISSHLFNYELIMKLKNYKDNDPKLDHVEVHELVELIFKKREELIKEKIKEKFFDD